MGSLEERNRKKTRRANIKLAILGSVALAGVLAVAVLAPNALRALKQFGLLPQARQKESVGRSCRRLLARGLLVSESGFLRLTPKGEAALRLLEVKNYKLKKPKRWDGKWRVLIFDVPERRKKTREQIRRTLIALGFVRLQDSVWLYPYDCEDILALLKADFRIGKDLVYMVVDQLQYDDRFRTHFGIR